MRASLLAWGPHRLPPQSSLQAHLGGRWLDAPSGWPQSTGCSWLHDLNTSRGTWRTAEKAHLFTAGWFTQAPSVPTLALLCHKCWETKHSNFPAPLLLEWPSDMVFCMTYEVASSTACLPLSCFENGYHEDGGNSAAILCQEEGSREL